MDDVRFFVKKLKSEGFCYIPVEKWNKDLYQQIQAQMPEKFKNKMDVKADGAWITLKLVSPPPLPEQRFEYPPRTFWRKFMPIGLFGLCYFILCYLFGGNFERLVSWPFLVGSPVALGALMVYAMNYHEPTEFAKMTLSMIVLMVVCILFSFVFLGEGALCVLLAAPILFCAIWVGALLMNELCHSLWKPNKKTMLSVALLPLLLLFAPESSQNYLGYSKKTIVVAARPEVIWQNIHAASAIRPEEVESAFIYKIGVPYPVSGITKDTKNGLVRYSMWQKGIHFEEHIQDWQPNRYVRWTYKFAPDSVPKGALDDHVTIGGKHFDLLDTAYTLTPLDGQKTRLDIEVRYRVTTDMNFYTGWWADVLIGDFSAVILDFYKKRSEAT